MTNSSALPGGGRWASGALALAFACVVACAGASSRPAPRPPATSQLPLPADLDVALRVDVASLSAELGEVPTRQFLFDAVSLEQAPPVTALLERSLARATLLWVGVPTPEADGSAAKVLVLRGHFADLDGAAGGPGWVRQLSGAETLELAGAPTTGYARVYRLPGADVLVWAPSAELPGVERALWGEPDEAALRPPERGAVSIAARPRRLLGRYGSHYPELAERLSGMRSIEAFAEPTAGLWRADLTLDFASAAEATDVSSVIERLKQALGKRTCAVGVLARALVLSRFEHSVRVQAVLLGPEIETVKACVLGDGCCA